MFLAPLQGKVRVDFQILTQSTFTYYGQQWKHQNNVLNLFKVNNKDTRTTTL